MSEQDKLNIEDQSKPEDKSPSQAEDQASGEESAAGAKQGESELDPLEAVSRERDELKNRFLRLAAETENYKKRTEREKAEFLKRANESLVKDLLPILDNLERALGHADQQADEESLRQGLELIYQDLKKVLERYGLEAVEAEGNPFDPELHEAMMQQENADVEDNTVLQQLQKGYKFQGRLIRPAMVVVSKRPAGEPEDDDGEEVPVTLN